MACQSCPGAARWTLSTCTTPTTAWARCCSTSAQRGSRCAAAHSSTTFLWPPAQQCLCDSVSRGRQQAASPPGVLLQVRHVAANPLQRSSLGAALDVSKYNCVMVLFDQLWVDTDNDDTNGLESLDEPSVLRLDSLVMVAQVCSAVPAEPRVALPSRDSCTPYLHQCACGRSVQNPRASGCVAAAQHAQAAPRGCQGQPCHQLCVPEGRH